MNMTDAERAASKAAGIFLAGAALAFCVGAALAGDWQVVTQRDEMTDAETCEVVASGERVDAGAFGYVPTIRVRMTAEGERVKEEAYFTIETEGLRRGRFEGQVRFDTNAVETVAFVSSTERRAGFFADGSGTVAKMAKARTMRIRFVTTLGAVRTLKFDLSGLAEKLPFCKLKLSKNRMKSHNTPKKC